MRVKVVNNVGGGFASSQTFAEGMTVGKIFESTVPNGNSRDYKIRRNNQPAEFDELVADGDTVTITPMNMKGA